MDGLGPTVSSPLPVFRNLGRQNWEVISRIGMQHVYCLSHSERWRRCEVYRIFLFTIAINMDSLTISVFFRGIAFLTWYPVFSHRIHPLLTGGGTSQLKGCSYLDTVGCSDHPARRWFFRRHNNYFSSAKPVSGHYRPHRISTYHLLRIREARKNGNGRGEVKHKTQHCRGSDKRNVAPATSSIRLSY